MMVASKPILLISGVCGDIGCSAVRCLRRLLVPGFVLTWAVAKEVNRPEHAGIATS